MVVKEVKPLLYGVEASIMALSETEGAAVCETAAAPPAVEPPAMMAPLGQGLLHCSQPAGYVTWSSQL
jgi:hypothetical protein